MKYFKNIEYGFLNEKHLTLCNTIIQISESKKFILIPHSITFIAIKSYIKPNKVIIGCSYLRYSFLNFSNKLFKAICWNLANK